MTMRWVFVVPAAALAVACSSSPPPAAAPAPAAPDSLQLQSLARARQDSIARAEAARAEADRLAAQRRADSIADAQRRAAAAKAALDSLVHFEFNSADLRPADIALLDEKLAILRKNPSARIRITGNCDERGSDEYNLALGNRRAIAARQYLVDRGIDGGRIETTSMGEERPIDPGHGEEAWARNRNDQLTVLGAVVF